jgi:hypothetical protein
VSAIGFYLSCGGLADAVGGFGSSERICDAQWGSTTPRGDSTSSNPAAPSDRRRLRLPLLDRTVSGHAAHPIERERFERCVKIGNLPFDRKLQQFGVVKLDTVRLMQSC